MTDSTNEEWRRAMGGCRLSVRYANDLLVDWIETPITQWTTLHDAKMLQSNASHLGHFGCLSTLRVVHIHNVDSQHNVVKLQYLASGPSREKLVICEAARKRFIPSDWIAESGGYALDAWWKFTASVAVESQVLLVKDNATNRQKAIETKGGKWLKTLTDNAIQENARFFQQFQYGPILLSVSMDGKTLFEKPELEYILTESQQSVARAKSATTGTDDSNWPGQREVARRMDINPGNVSRLLRDGDLKDNGKTGSHRKVDPASVLEYCKAKKLTYNADCDYS